MAVYDFGIGDVLGPAAGIADLFGGELPSAGLPMASERAMVLGFCGSKRA